MLVTGTLVYGKGDKLEAKREGLLEAGEERIFAPVAPAVPGDTQPSAVPGQRRSSVGTAPIAMRATPGSLKVCCQLMLMSMLHLIRVLPVLDVPHRHIPCLHALYHDSLISDHTPGRCCRAEALHMTGRHPLMLILCGRTHPGSLCMPGLKLLLCKAVIKCCSLCRAQ